ncbi:MAG: hypothetical protein AAF805_05245 [Planctomycetota bacterium]
MSDQVTAPPLDRQQATTLVAESGESVAADAGLPCVTQRSPGSESTYLHVLRDGWWRGVRVSCHAAVYDCCIDYAQVRLPEEADAESVRLASERVRRLVTDGGAVVADPAVVDDAIRRIGAALCDGRRYRDTAGVRWRWSSEQTAWRRVSLCRGDDEPAPPTHRPALVVSPRIGCSVRHAQNVAAKWAYDESVAMARPGPR